MKLHDAKQPLSVRIQLYIGFIVIITIIFLITFILHYYSQYESVIDNVGQKLRLIASVTASKENFSEEHRVNLKDISKAIAASKDIYDKHNEYEQLRKSLSLAVELTAEDNDVTINARNVFIVKMRDDKIKPIPIFSIIASDDPIDSTVIGKRYTIPTDIYPMLVDCYENNTVKFTQVYEEDKIEWISAFAPIIDHEVNIGIVCLKIPVSELSVPMGSSILLFTLFWVSMLIATYFVSWYISERYKKNIQILSTQVIETISSKQNIEPIWLKSPKELTEILRVINQILEKLSSAVVSEKFLDSIIRSLRDTIVITDSDGNIKSFSNSLLHLLKYTEEELENTSLDKILLDNPKKPNELLFFNMMTQLKTFEYEVQYKTKSGDLIPVTFTGIPMKTNDEIVGCIGVGRDNRLIHRFIKELENSKQTLLNKTSDQNSLNRELQSLKRKMERESKVIETFQKERDEIDDFFREKVRPHYLNLTQNLNELINSRGTKEFSKILPQNLNKIVKEVKFLGKFLNELVLLISKSTTKTK